MAGLVNQYLAIRNKENVPYDIKHSKVVSKFCHYANKLPKIAQRRFNILTLGAISTNLVTLIPIHIFIRRVP